MRESNTTRSVTKPSRCAVLLVDVINDLEFENGEKLLPAAQRMARALAPLVDRARAAGIPIIYANDNFGHWRSDFRAQVDHWIDGVRRTSARTRRHRRLRRT